MGRLLALDLGRKRCGVAVTDCLQIAATGLATVPTSGVEEFLRQYVSRESVDLVVVGRPVDLKGQPSDTTRYIAPVLARLRRAFPGLRFEEVDERFTSVLAHRAMIESGMPRTKRQDKSRADVMAATIMLNDYIESRKFQQR